MVFTCGFVCVKEYESKLGELESALVKQLHTDRTEIIERLDHQKMVCVGRRTE